MNCVGECVGRVEFGLSSPRGDRAPPHTRTDGETAFSASYDVARSDSYDCAATSSPFGPNCGSQKRLRFGSLPITKSRKAGKLRASDAAYAAKSAWSCPG